MRRRILHIVIGTALAGLIRDLLLHPERASPSTMLLAVAITVLAYFAVKDEKK